jgi:hypothetical protein
MGTPDPLRADAVPVYRFVRDHGPVTLLEIADACFPLSFGRDDPLYERLIRRSVGRVLDALTWMRGEGVVVFAHHALFPDDQTRFSLSGHVWPVPIYGTVSPLRVDVTGGERVTRPDEPTPDGETFGREAMGLYGHS